MKTKARVSTTAERTIPMTYSHIAAGPATDVGEDYFPLDVNRFITGGREGFVAWRVTGDSQAPFIPNGSIIFVDTYAEARSGNLIAANVNGLVCVKRFEHTPTKLRLVSHNESYAPRDITPRDAFQILGVVKAHLAVYS